MKRKKKYQRPKLCVWCHLARSHHIVVMCSWAVLWQAVWVVGGVMVPVRTSNNTAVSSTVTGQSVASSGSDEPSRVPVV